MTLIVTISSPLFVLQVGDRLLTTSERGKTQEFDAKSNKNVVFEASNGLATISYAGAAFIQGKPTDEWIAMQLHPWVKEMLADGADPWSVQLGASESAGRLSIDGVIKRLRERLSDLPDSETRTSGLTVVISGWRSKRSEIKSFLVEFTKSSNPANKAIRAIGFRRKAGVRASFGVDMVGSGDRAETRAYFDHSWSELHSQVTHPQSFEEYELYVKSILDLTVATVKFASSIEPTVGSNVHAVLLWKPEQPHHFIAETHFYSDSPHPVTLYAQLMFRMQPLLGGFFSMAQFMPLPI